MGTSSSHTAPTGGKWTQLKRVSRRFANQGGTSGGNVNPGLVTAAFVAALGGAAAATRKSAPAIRTGARLLDVISDAQQTGLTKSLTRRGLGDLVGRSPLEVIQALIDSVSGTGDTVDEAIARTAALDVLEEICGDADTYEDLERALGTTDAVQLKELLRLFLIRFVYLSMLNVIQDRIEQGTSTSAAARKIERDLRKYIEATVAFELDDVDIDKIDWSGPEGRGLVRRLLRDAYRYLTQE